MSDAEQNALVRTEVELETFKGRGGTDRTIARKADGKFANTIREGAKRSARDIAKLLHTIKEGETQTQIVRAAQSLLNDIIDNHDPDNLLARAKAFETLCKTAGFSDSLKKMLTEEDQNHGITFVLIPPPNLPNREPKPDIVAPTRPSWLDAEKPEPPFAPSEVVVEESKP